MSVEDLRSALQSADAALDELTALLAEERRLIERRSADELERLAVRKLGCLQRLQDAKPLGGLHSAQAIEQCLIDSGDAGLHEQWNRFRERLGVVRDANERNGIAIRHSLNGAATELAVLRGDDRGAADSTYGADGSAGRAILAGFNTRA